MRILYDSTTFVQQRYGGISRYFSQIIPRIVSMPDCRVSLYMGYYINRYGMEKLRDRYEHFRGFRRPFIGKTHRLAHWLSNKRFGAFAGRVPFDVYHTTGVFDPQYKTDRCKVITVHDMIHCQGLWTVPGAVKEMLESRIRSADGIVCVSESTRRDVVRMLNIPEEKLATIHHGAPERHEPVPGRIVGEPYILYVGFRPPYKNITTLIKAFAACPDLRKTHRLVFFGGGDFWPWETSLMAELNIADRITLIPSRNDAALANLYTHADALVYPSLYEGFGLPPLEAFTYGCPVACSNSSSLPEIAGDAALFFDPQNVDALAEILPKIVHEKPLREHLIAAGHERLKNFSWDKSAQAHVEFYRRISNAK